MSVHSRRNGLGGNAGFTILEDPPMTPQRSNGTVSSTVTAPARVTQARDGFTSEPQSSEGPSKAYISPNVTPRSGSRRARRESVSPQAQGTSNGATNPLRPLSAEKRQVNGSGVYYKVPKDPEPHEIPIPSLHHRSESGSSDGSELYTRLINGRNDPTVTPQANASVPKFFHASDAPASKTARSTSIEPTSRPNSVSSFTSRPNAPRMSPVPDEDRPKFFYANDIKDIRPVSTSQNTIINGVKKRPHVSTANVEPTPYTPQTFRPSSPLKEEILLDSPESISSSPLESPEQAIEADILSRRSSVNQAKSKVPRPAGDASPSENRKAAHSRKSSLNATTARARKSSLSTVPTDQDVIRSPPLPRLSRLFEAQDAPSSPTSKDLPMSPPPLSPAKGQSQLEHLNELAAKARRERKVLDLEISNSSLLAINQTLEREMRKMKGELRHLRRLSRPSRIPSSQMNRGRTHNILSQDVEDQSSEASGSESDQEDDNSSLLSATKSASNARNVVDENGTIKFKDQVIEPLDLSKQQKLLENGQNLNQSIRRCLGFSEELLRSGKEALASKGASSATEVEILGPRVLSPDEIRHEIGERRQGLLTPVIDRGSINPWERSLARQEDDSPKSIEEPAEEDSVDSIDPAIYDASFDSPNGHQTGSTSDTAKYDIKSRQNKNIDIKDSATSTPNSPSPLNIQIDPILTTPPKPSVANQEALRKLQGQPVMQAEASSVIPVDTMPPPALPSSSEASKDKRMDADEGQEKVHLPEEKQDTSSNPTENTPGNRGSVTKYLASFWSGASKIRPP